MVLKAALSYAERGWPVFPCSPATRAPLLPCDRDGAGMPIRNTGGVKKASTDPQVIRQWWTRWPVAMVAAATGAPIGAFVLDVDVKAVDGRAALADLEERFGYLPETWEAQSPSGGRHPDH
jgi:putative DNA primase/helicase